ncbi:flagellar motor protein MotB [Herbaspirillum huttiense]|jgi:chemotaxis protein MotB|uniref:Flagellar motor protein MotB n=1 Tax=Herbaspirillum huttiense subsp. lycopersici TaxID=3074428 RepID=A0ABU2EJ58_9BURK|nr:MULTISPECIES: flagellar motor protein MotB [Herbaspirillum]MAF03790.1 motility protein MotB [Herbaspirillum sp.]MBN9355637.1 flagellar motor protein MotB [Herbaspirillum huttiense]MBO15257.1 motility protein MotB [Herbaspirillum sp.]MBP1314048.1 chemotaxis protein MotB [Herbaspirillum sp. 1130]MCO4854987.1 flagellar motor protein MotB [Herbaspirillum sp. WGmk3]|tara:strand:- start:488 stop:1426 length:939 start_codon:yes stop_codon:yes gene_type:complete
MADEGLRPIIVKRIKKGGGGHHGGAWKIAYADFVTAMMAFFLLMWLLGSTAKGDLNGIAEYFKTPLKVAMAGGSGSGDANTVLPGGGKDLTRQDGQLRKGENDVVSRKQNLKQAQQELERAERTRLEELKSRLEKAIDSNPTLKQFKNQLLIDITSEGLRIQIVDEKNRPMFALASAQLQPYTKEILHEIGRTLNDVPNKISLSGHTDATPYSRGEKGYSNWELSADRANASRRELITGGMDESKVLRVVGLSSAVLLDKEDPFNPINRRISIIVMNKKAEELVEKDSGSLNVPTDASDEDVQQGLSAPAKN